MFGLSGAAIGGIAAGAGAIGGALIGSKASGDAADTQAAAADRATASQLEQFDRTRADQAPYREAGYSALSRLQELLGLGGNAGASGYGSMTTPFTGADVMSEPGYAFGLREGERAMQRAASASGRNLSGATLKALQRYGQDYAGTKFDGAFNRDLVSKNALFNRLSGISGTGQTATNQVDAAGQAFATAAGNNAIGAGNVAAANTMNQGNIWGNAVNQAVSAFQRRPSGVTTVVPQNFGTGDAYGNQDLGLYL